MLHVLSSTKAEQAAGVRFGRLRWTWLLLVLAAAAVYPALANNIAARAWDAAPVHIYRGFVYSNAISQGVRYPQWIQSLHGGLGSPAPTFEPPLPYAAMDFFYRLGMPHTVGWQVLMALALLAACTGAYALMHALTGQKWPAVLAAIAFLYAPYVLRDVFERGTPEALGVCLYPWVLWSLVWVARRPSGWRLALAAGIWALCISTHVLAPLMLAPVAVPLAMLLTWRYRTAGPPLALLAGSLLVAFIWLPIASEQGWVHVERDFGSSMADVQAGSIPLDQLLSGPAVYDTQSDNNRTVDHVGWLNAALMLAGLAGLYIAQRRRRRGLALTLGIGLAAGWLVIWLMTGASDPVWRAFGPVLERLQYRSRLLGLQALASATVAGALLTLLPRRRQPWAGIVLVAFVILTALPSLYVDLQHAYSSVGPELSLTQVRQAEIAQGALAFTSFGEFQPRWRTAPFDEQFLSGLGPNFNAQADPLAEAFNGVSIQAAEVRDGRWDLDVQAEQATVLTLHLLYYPRWQAWIDGQPAVLRPQPQSGYAQLDAPAGQHHISLRYGSTTAQQAALAISGLTLVSLLVGAAWPFLGPRPKQAREPVWRDAGKNTDAAGEAEQPPAVWLLAGLTALLALKIFFVDGSTTWLRCQSTAQHVCGAQTTVAVPFAGGPTLRGYNVLSGDVRPGGTIWLQLFWQGEPGQTAQLNGFVHIRNSQKGWPMEPKTGSEIWAQENHPAPGGLPSTEFLPGKLYTDDFRVQLPADMPVGLYFLEIGWYNPAGGEQLDPQPDAVRPPLKILWRSILLPSIRVR
jgi:6-pyruvoyl-tetrahydropterin synthase related domain